MFGRRTSRIDALAHEDTERRVAAGEICQEAAAGCTAIKAAELEILATERSERRANRIMLALPVVVGTGAVLGSAGLTGLGATLAAAWATATYIVYQREGQPKARAMLPIGTVFAIAGLSIYGSVAFREKMLERPIERTDLFSTYNVDEDENPPTSSKPLVEKLNDLTHPESRQTNPEPPSSEKDEQPLPPAPASEVVIESAPPEAVEALAPAVAPPLPAAKVQEQPAQEPVAAAPEKAAPPAPASMFANPVAPERPASSSPVLDPAKIPF